MHETFQCGANPAHVAQDVAKQMVTSVIIGAGERRLSADGPTVLQNATLPWPAPAVGRRGFDLQGFELAIEGACIDPDFLGGPPAVAVMAAKGLGDQQPLHGFERGGAALVWAERTR